MLQMAFLLICPKKLMKLRQLLRQTSMLASSEEEQPERVLPFLPSVRQPTSMMFLMAHESYCDSTSMMRTVMEVQAVSRKRHLYSCPTLARLHSGMGVFSSTLATFDSASSCISSFISPESGEGTFMKTPESTTADRVSGLVLVRRELTKLAQRKVATPPAEEPVSRTFSAEGKPQLSVSHLRWERTMLAPRKKSSASLYLQEFLVQPWCSDPSQQLKMTLVHSANLLLAGSVERYPCPTTVSSRYLLDPNAVLLRWQQLSSTPDSEVPSQYPPPTKYRRNLLRSVPWWKQRAGEEPSRHLASGSVLWMIFLQSAARRRRARARRRAILIKILLI